MDTPAKQAQTNSTNLTMRPATKIPYEGSREIKIQFISQLLPHENYLLTDAPQPPILIQIPTSSDYQLFLRKGIVGQVVGAGGIGKTHFLTQLALSVATGMPFLNKYHIKKKGYVFLGLGENSDEDIHRLLRKMSKALFSKEQLTEASKYLAFTSFSGKQASFISKDRSKSEFFKNFLHQLKASEPEEGWSLIILDPISRFLGADAETDNASATQFIALLESLILELIGRPTLLFGHHMSKANLSNTNTDQSAARGSSALTDGVRWQANLDRVFKDGSDKEYDPSKISFRVVKSNFTATTEKEILTKDQYGCLYQKQDQQPQQKLSAKDAKRTAE